MMSTLDGSIRDLREHLQWIKENERTKYQCPDYATAVHPSNCTPDEIIDCDLRLKRVLEFRQQTLLQLHDLGDKIGIDRAVMSTAAFIFDRYLSTFTPIFIRGEGGLPCRGNLIGVASLFIAAKSLMTRADFLLIKKSFRDYLREVFDEQVELKILEGLNWDIVYCSPISIIYDLITLLPRPCGYQEYD